MAKIKIDAKVDVGSKTLEKGMENAKGFLKKLIVPAVEEVGLLLKDHVSLWRLKHYVKTLNKAEAYCRKFNIEPKKIPVKLLSPLIDFASLEEDEQLQDKWAILLGNLVDSEQNIQNHVFPYILSQISIEEFATLEITHKERQERMTKLKNELDDFRAGFSDIEGKLLAELKEIELELEKSKEPGWHSRRWNEKMQKQSDLAKLKKKEPGILQEMRELEPMNYGALKVHEIINLVRLGLVTVVTRPYAYVSSTRNLRYGSRESFDPASLEALDIKIEREEDDHLLSELGELFIEACSVKKRKVDQR